MNFIIFVFYYFCFLCEHLRIFCLFKSHKNVSSVVFFLVYGFSFYVCDQFRLILEYGLTMQGVKREDVFKGLKLQSLVKKIKSTIVFVHLGIMSFFGGF